MSRRPPLPVVDAESSPFWEAARAGRLRLPYSPATGRYLFFPRTIDPQSGSELIEWREASGRGEIYSFTVVRRAPDPIFEARVPYVVVVIELDEGARMLSTVAVADVDAVRVGLRVRVQFERLSDEITLPTFVIDDGSTE